MFHITLEPFWSIGLKLCVIMSSLIGFCIPCDLIGFCIPYDSWFSSHIKTKNYINITKFYGPQKWSVMAVNVKYRTDMNVPSLMT